MTSIWYGENARKMPADLEALLVQIGSSVGVKELLLTSTLRTVEDQARIMVDMVKSRGSSYAHDLYGSAGDAVIEAIVCSVGETAQRLAAADEIRLQMRAGRVISRHIENPDYYAVDVSPRQLDAEGKQKVFIDAARAHPRVRQVIPPPGDPAVHVEFDLKGVVPKPPQPSRPVLRKGSTGPAVEELQRLLWVDGDFGAKTETAVIEFQKSRKMAPTGVVDDATWVALLTSRGIPS